VRIDGWRIDGFGVFSEAEVHGLPPGLTIVSGPNEAGKSTLLAFLRGVLFGFPDGRSRARRHEPVHGGRHGGAVTVLDSQDRRFVVERHLEPRSFSLRGPDGALAEDHVLSDLLGHADATLFANVFAFGLGELDSFELLDSDEVRDRVFSAGIVGGGRSARTALDTIDARRLALLRPRGRCDIRDLADQARRAARDLSAATAASRDLPRRDDEVEALRREADAARGRLADCRDEVRRAAALLDAWPAYQRLTAAESEIRTLDVPDGLDDEYPSRLSAARAELAGTEATHLKAVDDVAVIEARMAVVSVDDALDAVSGAVDDVVADLGAEAARTSRLAELDAVVDARRDELDGHLERLGPEWDRAHLAGFDVSIPAADEVRRRGDVSAGLASALASANEERTSLGRQLADIELELEGLEGEPDRIDGAPELERRERALRQLRGDMVDLGTETGRLDAAQGTLAGLNALSSKGGGRTSSIGALFLVVGAVLLAAGAVSVVGDGGSIAAGFLVTGAAAFVLGIVVLLSGRAAAGPEVMANLKAEQRDAKRARDDVQARIELLRTRIQASALVLGLSSEPTSDEVEQCAAAIDEEQRRIQQRVEARERRGGLQSQASRLREMLAGADASVAGLEVRAAADEAEWRRWKQERRVPVDLGVDAVNDMFTGIERARSALRELDAAEAERERLDEASSVWRARAAAILAEVGADDTGDPIVDVRRLADRLAADAAARQTRGELSASLADAEVRATSAGERADVARGQLVSVWERAGAVDDVEADEVVTRWRRRRDLSVEADAARAAVEGVLGFGQEAELLLAELSAGDVDEWARTQDAASERLPELETAHEAAIRAHHDAARELGELSRSADVADAGFRVEATRTRLSDAVDEWRTLTAARTIVADTLARYEHERQPAVLARAQSWFAQITEDHYRTVTVADGEIVLIDHAGRRLTTDDLSRGTSEQLYLCLRFGLAAEMVSHTPLPFVMDDVLVNFDPVRTERMAEVLASIADDHQVLLFTCQPSSVDALLAAAPSARVVELPRHGGR
jgi:uncharacterized protein YhaN